MITIIKTNIESTTQKETTRSILNRILRSLEKIWIQRNEQFIQWEKENNISQQDKRIWIANKKKVTKQKTNIPGINSIMNHATHNWINWDTLYKFRISFNRDW